MRGQKTPLLERFGSVTASLHERKFPPLKDRFDSLARAGPSRPGVALGVTFDLTS